MKKKGKKKKKNKKKNDVSSSFSSSSFLSFSSPLSPSCFFLFRTAHFFFHYRKILVNRVTEHQIILNRRPSTAIPVKVNILPISLSLRTSKIGSPSSPDVETIAVDVLQDSARSQLNEILQTDRTILTERRSGAPNLRFYKCVATISGGRTGRLRLGALGSARPKQECCPSPFSPHEISEDFKRFFFLQFEEI